MKVDLKSQWLLALIFFGLVLGIVLTR